jgi:muconate cycloisomerase
MIQTTGRRRPAVRPGRGAGDRRVRPTSVVRARAPSGERPVRSADIFSLKITKSGGFTVTQRIAAVAYAAGIPCHGGTAIESPIATAAAAHLYCSLPAVTYGSELFGPLLMAENLLTEPLDYRDGHLHPPHGPGLGITLDEDKVRRFART